MISNMDSYLMLVLSVGEKEVIQLTMHSGFQHAARGRGRKYVLNYGKSCEGAVCHIGDHDFLERMAIYHISNESIP